MKNVLIRYRPGSENSMADALSRNPVGPTSDDMDSGPVIVASVQASDLLSDVLQEDLNVEGQLPVCRTGTV